MENRNCKRSDAPDQHEIRSYENSNSKGQLKVAKSLKKPYFNKQKMSAIC